MYVNVHLLSTGTETLAFLAVLGRSGTQQLAIAVVLMQTKFGMVLVAAV